MHDALDMQRRQLLQRVALLLGASVVPTGPLMAASAKKVKSVLTAPRLELLNAVADTIVPATDTPGALAAKVPALLNAMLSQWASPATQSAIVAALDRIDAAAMTKSGKVFASLPPEERLLLLKAHDVASLKPVPSKPSSISPLPATVDPGYAKLKELIVVLYYQSEVALTTELTYDHAPGKWQPSIPLTPDTRQSGGPSLY